jgi:thymidine kinase
MTGRLELIIGCMFSGKSSELLNRIKKYKLLDKKILVVNHAKDVRYGSGIVSHDKRKVDAIALARLQDILFYKELNTCQIVVVDEAQFFEDLYDIVVKLVEGLEKTVIISALDGTYERKPFFQVMQLVPFADDVVKLHALCLVCKDGTRASFSRRIVDVHDTELIGGLESYIPVCRKHFH